MCFCMCHWRRQLYSCQNIWLKFTYIHWSSVIVPELIKCSCKAHTGWDAVASDMQRNSRSKQSYAAGSNTAINWKLSTNIQGHCMQTSYARQGKLLTISSLHTAFSDTPSLSFFCTIWSKSWSHSSSLACMRRMQADLASGHIDIHTLYTAAQSSLVC